MRVLKTVKNLSWTFWVNQVANLSVLPQRIRIAIYKFHGLELGDCGIYSGQYFCGSNVKIGDGSFINHKCFFENTLTSIEIGDNCSVAMEVMFCGATHELSGNVKRAGKPIGGAIKVGNGSWIGARSLILPGVTIGEGCIIAAGSLVTKDCEPNGLYAGSPARRIKDLSQ